MGALIGDIWRSLRSLPLWVQIWMFVILVPANLLSILFLDQPFGTAVAVMAIGGIAPNAVLMVVQRGFSKAMAISHLIFWIPLILLLLGMITGELPWSQGYVIYFWCLLIINAISLVFDVLDFGKWFQGDRGIAGSANYGSSGYY
jgi:hypothetical protein